MNTTAPPRALITESAAWAWHNSTQDCLQSLDRDFVAEWRTALDQAGEILIAPHLATIWHQHGYNIQLVRAASFAPAPGDGPDDDTRFTVADQAAAAIEPADLLIAANLVDEYRAEAA